MKRASFVLVLAALACARTGLIDFGTDDSGDAGAGGTTALGGSASGGTSPEECRTNSDCPLEDLCAPPRCVLDGSGSNATLRCIAMPIDCNDQNSCSTDRCDSSTGECVFELPEDEDGDGFFGEPPADAPETCGGEDCDDTDPTVNPLGVEICDGRDNDCNGGIDERLEYTNIVTRGVPIAPPERGRATHGGLVWNGETFAVSYNTTSDHKRSYFKLITASGQDASEETLVSEINADAFAGPIEWSGSSFFTAFSDARQGGNYEIYAARFRSDGVKVQGAVRLTDARDFSLNPVVVWTGEEYVVLWDDRRGRTDGGVAQIFARRFNELGTRIGDEVLVSPTGEWGESPALAVGDRSLGFAYVSLGPDAIPRVRFRTMDFSLGGLGPAVDLPGSEYANFPSIAFAGGRFLVAWAFSFDSSLPGSAVHMAAVDESGGAPTGGHAVTFGYTFVRGPSLVSLGDRVVLIFSGQISVGNYDLWHTVVPTSLTPRVGGTTQLTATDALSLFPYAARGANGTIGIVFDEDDETPPTSRTPYFMSIGCQPPTLP